MASSYRDLIAWQKAMDLAQDVYRASGSFPREEMYGLTSQLRRCAISIPSNIAEGQGRMTKKDFKLFLGHARGSLLELETQVILAEKLGYLKSSSSLLNKGDEVKRILNGLIQSMEEKPK